MEAIVGEVRAGVAARAMIGEQLSTLNCRYGKRQSVTLQIAIIWAVP